MIYLKTYENMRSIIYSQYIYCYVFMKTVIQPEDSLNESLDLMMQTTHLLEPQVDYKNKSDIISSLKENYQKTKYKIFYTLEIIFVRPRWFLVFILARFSFVRQLYSLLSKLRSTSMEMLSCSNSLFQQVNPTEVVDVLKRDGVYLDFALPSHILEGILHHTRTQNCFAGGISNMGFKISEKDEIDRVHPRPFYIARYFNISSSWSEISHLATDPKLQQIASKYIGHRAKYTGASLFWTFPIEGRSHDYDQQEFKYFHYDIDDLAGLRFCFYLTEVDDESGPTFIFVVATSKSQYFMS